MTSYDIQPTEALTGIHMVGTVVRRFLISYAVPPEALASHVPPGAELSLFDGKAWVSACFVRMDDMRPSFTPSALGVKYNYLIHRTRARLPFPDGKTREGVLVLEPNINSRLLAGAGARITQIGFKKRDIRLDKMDEGWRIQMIHEGEMLYDATISFTESCTALPPGSCFAGPAEADRFLLGVSHGGEWARERACLYLLPETHEPWQTLVSSCETRDNRFLDELGYPQAVADHASTMADIPHYFGLRPVTVKLGKA